MGHRLKSSERTALVALIVTALLLVTKLVLWGATSSLAVLSQALDSGLDLVALGLVFFGVRIATKPADISHHYGHSKAENLAAFAQTVFLGVVMAGIVIEAVRRLAGTDPPVVDTPGYAFAILIASAVIDAIRAAVLASTARRERSEALLAGALNIASDVGTTIVALVNLVLVTRGVETADAIGALLVAGVVGIAAYRMGKRSVDILMDRAPALPVEEIRAAANRAPGVEQAGRVRVRGSADHLFADITVTAGRTASLERAHDIAEAVEKEIAEILPGTDVVVHVEPATATSGLVERVLAAASRVEGVHEIHNVLVHAFEERGSNKLHVTLHAKLPLDTTVESAHTIADRIETAVAEEIGGAVRVDAHLEPLETTVVGRDVTASRTDVVDTVRSAAIDEPDVADCHEIVLSSSVDGLRVVAHVRGRRNLPLARIHAASERIEKKVHSAHPDVASVLIHFEPTE